MKLHSPREMLVWDKAQCEMIPALVQAREALRRLHGIANGTEDYDPGEVAFVLSGAEKAISDALAKSAFEDGLLDRQELGALSEEVEAVLNQRFRKALE